MFGNFACPGKFGRLGATPAGTSPYLPRYSYGVVNNSLAAAVTALAKPAAKATVAAKPVSVVAAKIAAPVKSLAPPIVPNLKTAVTVAPVAASKVVALKKPAIVPRAGGKMQGLGYLGMSQDVAATAKGASEGAMVATAAGAAISGAIAMGLIGQTAIPIPGVGFVIGAIIGEAMQLLKAREGKAAKSWDSLIASWPGAIQQHPQIGQNEGRSLTELAFGEGFKGMMDKGQNIFPGCGADGHKNPDCFNQPLANVIVKGYVSGAVPLDAGTAEVYQTVVQPWLAAGANGLVNWTNLQKEPTQQMMIMAAVDRYLAGMPITRADMVEYSPNGASPYVSQGFHTPSLVDALIAAGVLASAPPVVQGAPPPPAAPAGAHPISSTNPGAPPATTATQIITAPAGVDPNTAAMIAALQAQGANTSQILSALQAQGVQPTAAIQAAASSDMSSSGSGLSSSKLIIIALFGVSAFLLLNGHILSKSRK